MPGRPSRPRHRALLTSACLGAAVAAALTGCSSASSTGTNAGATTTPSTTSTTSTSVGTLPSAATTTTQPQAASTSLDPCHLVTQAEASALAGARFGAGQESPSGAGKRCVYGGRTPNVFTVEVVQAKDAATAAAVWSQAQAQARSGVSRQLPPGLRLSLDTTSVAIGDKAATVMGSATVAGHSVGFSGIYVLKGATFFAFQDLLLTRTPPALSAMEDQAKTTLTRVS